MFDYFLNFQVFRPSLFGPEKFAKVQQQQTEGQGKCQSTLVFVVAAAAVFAAVTVAAAIGLLRAVALVVALDAEVEPKYPINIANDIFTFRMRSRAVQVFDVWIF